MAYNEPTSLTERLEALLVDIQRHEILGWPPEKRRAHINTLQAALRREEPPPFKNCSFRICDLPGQCKGEGKCHHPAANAASAEKDQRASAASSSAGKTAGGADNGASAVSAARGRRREGVKPKLTAWYPPEVKPVRKGVYEIDPPDKLPIKGLGWFSLWKGEQWGSRALNQHDALSHGLHAFARGPIGKWRGLASPAASAKAE